MKKNSKKTLAKRGILVAGRAQNAGGAQIHADKRRTPRNLEKQRLETQLQHETARDCGPFRVEVGFRDAVANFTTLEHCALNDQAHPPPEARSEARSERNAGL